MQGHLMPHMRLTAAALAALILLPSGPAPEALASPAGLDPSTSYCTRREDGSCYFPGFRVSEVPELLAGRTVTITGAGATTGAATAPKVRGGLARIDAAEHEDPLVSVEGSVEADGTWSVTMTLPDQGTVDRAGPLRIWFQADGPDEAGVYVLHEISAPVALPRTPDPQPSVPAPQAAGWHRAGDTWFWADERGVRAKGWKRVGASWYFFDTATAAMRTGWVRDGGSWYYLTGSGAMATGWVKDGGSWYYLTGSGAMATGWVKVGGSWYYLTGSGAMATGWVKVGGSWYYLTGSGAMATGWVRDGGSWYYLTGSGAMATGWLVVDGRWSLFAPNGAWQHYG
ncbi:N-acetylmuramoyl-L-alanine amidase family protein [Actinomyces bowdenii]|uniref:N-acetylmuramoyl-L-alanine amidase family protein n=1 Tax=Actinomyces bowdenii TaxID=131109 RepID=A0A3P1VBD1_9ACTO|nr:N-acetylmuramoyl-L-alanine amidase family protein [Actinomyces bowdenii]RRD30725.1 N-acetylmuramoyl-L-alanine amidase family protein [Actinomyces bowdenii]